MKPAVATLAILAAGTLSLAFADPPTNPVVPEPQSTTARDSTAEDTTSQSSAAHAVPAAAAVTTARPPDVAPAQPTPSPSAEQVQDQEQARLLRNQGYKLRMVNGKEKYCRRETPLGSHLATVMHCVTVAEAEAMAREGRETAERLQRNQSACIKDGGRCGN